MSSLPPPGPTFTLRGCLEGAGLMLPLVPGLVVYALAFGSAAAQRGLTLGESLAMSGIVYAGAAQMVSLELWREVWTPGALVAVALVTMTVNARFVLMGASLQPWMRGAPPVRTALQLFFLVDATWLIGARYQADGGRDLGIMLGAGLFSWAVWVLATAPGYLAASLVPEPRRFGLDLVMPIFFGAMAVPLWRGLVVSGAPWGVAALVALAVDRLSPGGYAFIVAGALAGAATGALLHDRR